MKSKFQNRSILLMILFAFITVGIYYPYYFLKNRKIFESLKTKVKPSYKFYYTYLGIAIILLLASISRGLPLFEKSLIDIFTGIYFVFYVIDIILILILAFELRSILQEHFDKTLKKKVVLSGLGTFFFTI